MGENKANSKMYNEILKIEEEFENIERIFNEEDETEDISMEIKKLSFIISKLDILDVGFLDDMSKERCRSLMERIDRFKEDIDLDDYISKIEIIQILRDLTTCNRKLHKYELLMGINEILKTIKITESNVYDIVDNDLVYFNKIDDNNPNLEGLTREEREAKARDMLANLFLLTAESFESSQKPFDIYEKIMIINILDNARKHLN